MGMALTSEAGGASPTTATSMEEISEEQRKRDKLTGIVRRVAAVDTVRLLNPYNPFFLLIVSSHSQPKALNLPHSELRY
ncbi:unnamed protein product [Allacma fusca]|uniref:Uncharacterized protein n=1 Tax=Allacma fusca TaxID=39272 RepID=A0A8J2PPB2_9HEXA|nr:unnamed protein product [Allacma fusca]